MSKICKDCKIEKNKFDFYSGTRRCKICARILAKIKYNPIIEAEKRKIKKEKDLIKWILKRKEYNLRYENKNKAKLSERRRDYQRKLRENKLIIKDKDKAKESVKKWREKYPEKRKARYILTSKLNRNLIKKPEKCQVCNMIKKLEGHHHDYSKPLDVIWCCKECHGKFHRKF